MVPSDRLISTLSGRLGPVGHDIQTARDFLRIQSLDFYGPFAQSPNREYVLGWEDADYRSKGTAHWRGGARDQGAGRIVLVHRDALLWQLDLERPNDGAVADSGHSVVSDWRFGTGAHGTFYALDRDGRVLIRKDFRSNLDKAGISTGGSLCWCTILSTREEPDASTLFVFATNPAALLFKVSPLYWWRFTGIEDLGDTLKLSATEGEYIYSRTGELLNESEVRAAWEKSAVERGRVYELLFIARDHLSKCPPEKMEAGERARVSSILERVFSKGPSPDYKAAAARVLGEVSLACGDKAKALHWFREALALNPKVGVKQLVQRLEKELS